MKRWAEHFEEVINREDSTLTVTENEVVQTKVIEESRY